MLTSKNKKLRDAIGKIKVFALVVQKLNQIDEEQKENLED